jgi:hypothetical protein
MSGTAPERWLRADGSTVACTESVKVLNENWSEVREALQDMYEDAVLLGCGKAAFKRELHRLVTRSSAITRNSSSPSRLAC